MMPDKKTCFVIAPIGEEDSETRERSNKLLKHVISPVVSDKGYDPIRADEIAEPGLITSQIIQHVAEDELVVADLTERNPNVFYELAIRHALRLPLVQMISHGEGIPFDLAGMRTIEVDIKDLDSVDRAKRKLASQIDAVEANPGSIDTPIALALDLQNLRQSGNPEGRSLAELVASVSELRTGLASIERRLADPEGLFPPQYIESLSKVSLLKERNPRDGGFARNAIDFALERIDEAVSSEGENRENALGNARAALREVAEILG